MPNRLAIQADESDTKYLKEIKPVLVSIHAALNSLKEYAENDYQFDLAMKEVDLMIESVKDI